MYKSAQVLYYPTPSKHPAPSNSYGRLPLPDFVLSKGLTTSSVLKVWFTVLLPSGSLKGSSSCLVDLKFSPADKFVYPAQTLPPITYSLVQIILLTAQLAITKAPQN